LEATFRFPSRSIFIFFVLGKFPQRKKKNKKSSDFGVFYGVWGKKKKEKARKNRQISIFSFQL
jgi:hypothetical protein